MDCTIGSILGLYWERNSIREYVNTQLSIEYNRRIKYGGYLEVELSEITSHNRKVVEGIKYGKKEASSNKKQKQ